MPHRRRRSAPVPAARPAALVGLLAVLVGCAPAASAAPHDDAPRPDSASPLVVLLVVDQLRPDLLERYDDLFTGGIRRLLDDGRSFTDVTMQHLVTETAPGHATLSTGTHPVLHGVVSNLWYERTGSAWVGVENVLDRAVAVPGHTGDGLTGASPGVLERSGVADWLLAAYPEAHVVSVSAKPRGAVLLAGQGTADRDVYWFEPAAGAFVTSSVYGSRTARWVERFNEGPLQAFRSDTLWGSTVPGGAVGRTRPDTATFEAGQGGSWFPHGWRRDAAARREAGYAPMEFWEWWTTTPGPDRATLLLAEAAIEARELGADETPDLLTVSLSQTDRIGHGHGPLSREQLDNLLRLDAALAAFFERLDTQVGEGRWSVVLTADHGAMDMPEHTAGAGGVQSRRLGAEELSALQTLLLEVSREVRSTEAELLADPLARAVGELEWVARAWSHEGLHRGEPADSFDLYARNSFRGDRVTGLLGRLGVEYQVAPGVLPFGFETGGSTHQSGYLHDRAIPLVVMGPGIAPGRVGGAVGGVAVAPTVAHLLGVAPPDDLPEGSVLRGSSSPAS